MNPITTYCRTTSGENGDRLCAVVHPGGNHSSAWAFAMQNRIMGT